MDKTEKLLAVSAEIVLIVCVTCVAMYFRNAALLWWYVLALLLRAYRFRKEG